MAFRPSPTSLSDLVAQTEGAAIVSGDEATPIGGVTQDTRRLQPGDLFVAVPGLQHDGLQFLPQALAAGAAAVAAERLPEDRPGVPLVLVENARAALADLAAALYGHPSRQMAVVGITGTDGKTSTTHLLSAILEAHGLRTGWLTTVNTKIGSEVRPNAADHTTPEAPLVQHTLAEMYAARVDVAILETSSHALDLDRVRGTSYQVGVFTNLSPEHINFHGSFDAYRAAKRKLFERLPATGVAVLNADDPNSQAMAEATSARILTYALDANANADLTASDIRLSPGGTTFTLHIGPPSVRPATFPHPGVSRASIPSDDAASPQTGVSPAHIPSHDAASPQTGVSRASIPSDDAASPQTGVSPAHIPSHDAASPDPSVSRASIPSDEAASACTLAATAADGRSDTAVGASSSSEPIEVRSQLVGRFNVANWLAAYAAATVFGATPDDLVRAAASQPPVPGRMNLVDHGQPFAVVVDFAHTPQALEKALDTVRSLLGSEGRVFLAFGLAGGRDFANRPVMGALAARKADFVAITMDDPGDEDPAAIADEIAAGATSVGAQPHQDFAIELDRRAAIRLLFERARPGDAVLLAGKGHEQRMVVGGERRAWNDSAVAAELLAELGHRSQAVP
jgi:UDP-N-acetylmuramyl tripeptide synthase